MDFYSLEFALIGTIVCLVLINGWAGVIWLVGWALQWKRIQTFAVRGGAVVSIVFATVMGILIGLSYFTGGLN